MHTHLEQPIILDSCMLCDDTSGRVQNLRTASIVFDIEDRASSRWLGEHGAHQGKLGFMIRILVRLKLIQHVYLSACCAFRMYR